MIEVRPHRPRDMITKEEVDGSLYRIFKDDKPVGFIGYQKGARPMIVEKMSPAEAKEIEVAVAEQLKDQETGPVAVVPDPPEQPETQEDNSDDFDQGGTT